MGGEEALRIALDQKPNLVILDGELPGLNGFDVCRQLRANTNLSGIKIIMYTGGIRGNEAQQARDAGADRFLPKQAPANDLLTMARELLKT